jgi:hypothetical protein
MGSSYLDNGRQKTPDGPHMGVVGRKLQACCERAEYRAGAQHIPPGRDHTVNLL